MKHPLSKLHKKTRNVVSGILVGVASIFAIINYVKMPREQIMAFLMGTAILIGSIIVLAVICVVIIKGLQSLKKRIFGE